MTEQEIFTKAYTVLRDRGFTRAGVPDESGGFTCLYRSPIGPCAAGIFITDEEYSEDMEGNAIFTIMSMKEIKAFKGICPDFLAHLQADHDDGTTPELMRERLIAFAKEYNLEVPK